MAEEEKKDLLEDEDKEPEPLPVKWKKIVDEGHGGAHGGAWKIALADMMTAMMAFFLLMWLLGSTDANDREGIAEYFTETDRRDDAEGETAGAGGFFGGTSMIDPDGIPSVNFPKQTQLVEAITPDSEPGPGEDQGDSPDDNPKKVKYAKDLSKDEIKEIEKQTKMENLDTFEKEIQKKISENDDFSDLKNKVNFIREKNGLRVEIIDEADFSMFTLGTAKIDNKAKALIQEVAKSVSDITNKIAIKGHTDSVPFAKFSDRSNWSLSIERAEITRRLLESGGLKSSRFERIEGVADTEPFNNEDLSDSRNRRISITILYDDPPIKDK